MHARGCWPPLCPALGLFLTPGLWVMDPAIMQGPARPSVPLCYRWASRSAGLPWDDMAWESCWGSCHSWIMDPRCTHGGLVLREPAVRASPHPDHLCFLPHLFWSLVPPPLHLSGALHAWDPAIHLARVSPFFSTSVLTPLLSLAAITANQIPEPLAKLLAALPARWEISRLDN